MHDALGLVEIIERLGHLDDDVSAEVLAEVGEPDDLMEELATGTELEDDVIVLRRLGELDELDDIRVVELSHDLNLLEDVRALRRRGSRRQPTRSIAPAVRREGERRKAGLRWRVGEGRPAASARQNGKNGHDSEDKEEGCDAHLGHLGLLLEVRMEVIRVLDRTHRSWPRARLFAVQIGASDRGSTEGEDQTAVADGRTSQSERKHVERGAGHGGAPGVEAYL